jgi:hypothetical protein
MIVVIVNDEVFMKNISILSKLSLMFVITVLISSCKAQSLSTLLPGFVHFSPTNQENIKIQFNYPSSWSFRPDQSKETDSFVIYDPAIQPPPPINFNPENTHDNWLWGSVYWGVYPKVDSVKSMAKYIDATIKPVDPDRDMSVLRIKARDKVVLESKRLRMIGCPAHRIVLKYTLDSYGDRSSTIYEKDVYIACENTLYHFELSILEEDKNGPFEKDFDALISSIQPYP